MLSSSESVALRRSTLSMGQWLAAFGVCATFVWSYWHTLADLANAWNHTADYSHGFLVAPLAAYFLWLRRDRWPGKADGICWLGISLIAFSLAMRLVSARFYLKAVDAWSIPVWWAGVIWFFAGWRACRWSMPALAFLLFMAPLPFRVETWLSVPLQAVATKLSVWTLQCLGMPAIAEGNVIRMASMRLEVEQACSGLRVLVGIAALAAAYMLVIRQSWLERALLVVSIVPIALVANSIRIVMTALLFEYASGDAARKFTHDFAGWATILVAAAFFATMLLYLRFLLPEEEVMDVASVLRTGRQRPATELAR